MSVSHGLAGRSDFDKVATADSQLDAICASRWIGLDLVLPKPDDRPAAPAEATEVFGVPSHIPLDLLAPVGSQTISPLVEPPPVPEVAVDENSDPGSAEDDIGLTRQDCNMNAVPKPSTME